MMTPEEIEALLRHHPSAPPQSQDDGPASEPPAGDCESRTALLAPVLSACEESWASRSENLDGLLQKLADGSRDVAWRLPLGESGILDFCLTLLAKDDVRRDLQIQALRLVGNSCADTDQNRARAVAQDRLSSISRHVQDEALLVFTVSVLYNVLVDYEPAQLLASRSGLNRQLVAHLSFPNMSSRPAVVLYISKILALLVAQDGEPAVADPSTANVLLGLASSEPSKADVETFATLVEAAVAYLANDLFQLRLIAGSYVGLFMDAFHHVHAGWRPSEVEDPDTTARLKRLQAALLTVLSDISGHDSFPAHYPLSSTVAQSLLAWIRGTNLALQTAACLALGNLSRSDKASVDLVENYAVHLGLTELLSKPAVTDSQLLHLALSFCRNLAIPPQNKVQLGHLLASGCIPRILSLDTLPQVQFAAMSLTRLLLANCPPNVRRACTPLSTNPSDPRHGRTCVALITSVFDKSDSEPTKLEAARSIAALCRALHSSAISDVLPGDHSDLGPAPVEESKASKTQSDVTGRRRQFYEQHSLSRPLAFLVALQKWPILRSEAWFVLALMSRSTDGASVVHRVLDIQAAADALNEAISGRKAENGEAGVPGQIQDTPGTTVDEAAASLAGGSPLEPRRGNSAEQVANMSKADRENAVVLCTGLLKNGEGSLPPARLALLKGLVSKGSELVVADRSRT